jgi:hypothetical protein
MIFILKSFPKIHFFLFVLVFILFCCSTEPENKVDNEQFIEIYSRLLIIHEMDINKEYHDRLLSELFEKYNVTAADIDSMVSYLNLYPDEWLDILSRVKDRINEIKKKATPETRKPIESEKKPLEKQEVRKNEKSDRRRVKDQLKRQIKRQKKPLRDQKE